MLVRVSNCLLYSACILGSPLIHMLLPSYKAPGSSGCNMANEPILDSPQRGMQSLHTAAAT